MAVATQLKQYAARRLTRRLARTVPLVGSLIALVTLGGAIRRKGFMRGTLDTALDFVPFIGTAKNVAEIARGRDFIPERREPRRS
jgi:putative toxin of predicted polymorphic toxin system